MSKTEEELVCNLVKEGSNTARDVINCDSYGHCSNPCFIMGISGDCPCGSGDEGCVFKHPNQEIRAIAHNCFDPEFPTSTIKESIIESIEDSFPNFYK